jgi:hypothetical protein
MESVNNAAGPVVPKDDSKSAFISLLLILLVFITIFQFASFGMQSVKYILGVIFSVPVNSTPLDAGIGFLAMVASVYVFSGSILEWMKRQSATKYLTIGAGVFVFKNVLDLINVTILYNMEQTITSADQITELAGLLGQQFFQLAFWVFVIAFFKYVRR